MSDDSDFTIIDDDGDKDTALPSIEIECEKCGHNQAVWWTLQT